MRVTHDPWPRYLIFVTINELSEISYERIPSRILAHKKSSKIVFLFILYLFLNEYCFPFYLRNQGNKEEKMLREKGLPDASEMHNMGSHLFCIVFFSFFKVETFCLQDNTT